jgi:hypothetical protein
MERMQRMESAESRNKMELEQLAEDINMLQAALRNGEIPEKAKPQYQKMLKAMIEQFQEMLQDIGSLQQAQSQEFKFAENEQMQNAKFAQNKEAEMLKFAQAREQQGMAEEQQRRARMLKKSHENMLPDPPSNYMPSPG